MRCGACGYDEALHEQDGHCPLCACGAFPREHLAVAYPPAPIPADKREVVMHCPGKGPGTSGRPPKLRRGSFREPSPPPPYRLHAGGFYVPVLEDEPPVAYTSVLEPRVPLRDTYALSEIAPRAMGLGKAAAALGWAVDPLYGVTGLGVEVSALRMRRSELRALASWERPEGGSWKASGGWGWRVGEPPVAVGVTQLGKTIRELGELT